MNGARFSGPQDFFTAFLAGMSGSNQLLNAFMRREIVGEQLKGLREQRKQTDIEVQQGIQELVQGQQQAQQQQAALGALLGVPSQIVPPQYEQPPEAQAALTQAAMAAADARTPSMTRAVSPEVIRQGVQAQRIARERQRIESRLVNDLTQAGVRAGLSSGDARAFGQQQITYAQAELPAEVRTMMFRAQFADKLTPDAMTALERQAHELRLRADIASSRVTIREANDTLAQMRQNDEQARMLTERLNVYGVYDSLQTLQRELKLDQNANERLDRLYGSITDPSELAQVRETFVDRFAGRQGVTRPRLIALAYPLDAQFRTRVELGFANGASIDQILTELDRSQGLDNLAQQRLEQRWLAKEGFEKPGDLSQDDLQTLAEYIRDNLAIERQAMREALEQVFRWNFGPTQGFTTVQPSAAVGMGAPTETQPSAQTEPVPTAREINAKRAELREAKQQRARLRAAAADIPPQRGEGGYGREGDPQAKAALPAAEERVRQLERELEDMERRLRESRVQALSPEEARRRQQEGKRAAERWRTHQ